MTTVDHALHYAIPTAFVVRALGAPDPAILAAAVVVGLVNAIPDLSGPVAGALNPLDVHVTEETISIFGWKVRYPQRWDIYWRFHWGDIAKKYGWLWKLHLIVDKKFHEQNGKSWWPEQWPLASAYWTLEAAALVIYFLT